MDSLKNKLEAFQDLGFLRQKFDEKEFFKKSKQLYATSYIKWLLTIAFPLRSTIGLFFEKYYSSLYWQLF